MALYGLLGGGVAMLFYLLISTISPSVGGLAVKPISVIYDFQDGLYVNGAEVFSTTGVQTEKGAVGSDTAGLVPTHTLTADQLCDNSMLKITVGNTTTPTWTLPTSALLLADCLPNVGDYKDITIFNSSAATSSIIAAGSGGTLYFSSSSTIGASDTAILRLHRDTAAAYKAILTNQPS